MGTVDENIVKQRVGAILFINRLDSYSGTASGSNSRYQSNDEITDTIREVDALLCQARMSTTGDPYRSNWMQVTGSLASGDRIPAFVGVLGDIDVKNGSAWAPARYAASRADVIEMRRNPALYPNVNDWVAVEDGRIFHNAEAARAHYPNFEKRQECQSPDVDESALVYGTVASLAKDGSVTPEVFEASGRYFQAYLAMIKGEPAVLPDVARFETNVR